MLDPAERISNTQKLYMYICQIACKGACTCSSICLDRPGLATRMSLDQDSGLSGDRFIYTEMYELAKTNGPSSQAASHGSGLSR